MDYKLTQLYKENWKILKEIRLEALYLEAKFFGSNYEQESVYTSFDWKNFIGEPINRAFFILKKEKEVIGLTGIFRDRDNYETGFLIASYIKAEYRKKGLSILLYQARLNWAKEQGFKTLVVSHTESNLASKMANQKFGFQFTHTTDKIWNDGKAEKIFHYQLDIT